MKHLVRNGGFIAFISILVVSVLLFGMTLTLAQFGITTRFGLLNKEQKHASAMIAESCIHYGEIFIANEQTYTLSVPTSLPVEDETCTLVEVALNGSTHTIKASGVSGNAVTNLIVEVDTNTGTLLSWKEVASF